MESWRVMRPVFFLTNCFINSVLQLARKINVPLNKSVPPLPAATAALCAAECLSFFLLFSLSFMLKKIFIFMFFPCPDEWSVTGIAPGLCLLFSVYSILRFHRILKSTWKYTTLFTVVLLQSRNHLLFYVLCSFSRNMSAECALSELKTPLLILVLGSFPFCASQLKEPNFQSKKAFTELFCSTFSHHQIVSFRFSFNSQQSGVWKYLYPL